MADAKKSEAEAAVSPPEKKNRGKLILIIGAIVLLIAGGGAAAFFMLKKPPADAEAAEGAAKKVKKAEPGAPPVFYKFDKPFTVKLMTDNQDAYLQTELQLKLLDASGADAIKQNEPELKHRITLTLMSKKSSALATADGVQRLANELRDTINNVVSPATAGKEKAADKPAEKPADGSAEKPAEKAPAETADPSAVVQSVLFSSFIIQ